MLDTQIPKFYFSAGAIKVGATLRFLLFGSSSEEEASTTVGSGTSLSRFCGIIPVLVAVGVSGGVPRGAAEPVDDTERFRVV